MPSQQPTIEIPDKSQENARRASVVHLTSVHRPTDQRIFQRECRTLAGNGYAVTLIAPHEESEVRDGVAVRAVPRPRNRFARMTTTLWRVYREALRQNADVYHFHDPELIPVGSLLRLHGKTVIYDMHENVPAQIAGGSDKGWIPQSLRKPVSRIFAVFERAAAPGFSAIVTANSEISRHANEMNRRVVLLGNYPEAVEFRDFAADPSRFYSGRIVNFAGISSRACTKEVVQALGMLPDELNAEMLLGGSATLQSYANEVTSLPGWRRVKFVGSQPRQRLMQELRDAAVAIVLFSPAPNHYGIGSNRFYEALAAGVPVIVSDFPQWRAAMDRLQCGLAVQPRDPGAIAKAITFLLTHPEDAARMGARGREAFLNEYCWDSEKRKLLDLYQELTAA